MLVDRATLRDLALTLADLKATPGKRNGAFPPEKVDPLVDLAVGELYDEMVSAYGQEYFESEDASTSTVSGTAVYATPARFYKLLSLHLRWPDGLLEEVDRLDNIGDRHRLTNWRQWSQWDVKAYRLRGSSLELFPTPTSAAVLVYRYIPEFARATADTGTAGQYYDIPNGWERLIALRVALDLYTIQKIPFGNLQSLYQQERDRVREMASDRALAAPARIRDVRPEGFDDRFWWPRGRAP